MKYGFRRSFITTIVSGITSVKPIIKNELRIKVSRGYGWSTNLKRLFYNKVYRKTSVE